MKSYFKYFLILVLNILIVNPAFCVLDTKDSSRGLKGYEFQGVDAKRNATLHSNMGNIYFDEKNYIAAIKEYEIAFNLGHDTPNAPVYLYNIARSYMMLGNYSLAKNALEGAISKDCINITYYENLVDCYIKLKIQNEELKKHLKDTRNPYNRIVVGLIFLKTGRKTDARIIFDEFVNNYPDMLITDDVRRILNKI